MTLREEQLLKPALRMKLIIRRGGRFQKVVSYLPEQLYEEESSPV